MLSSVKNDQHEDIDFSGELTKGVHSDLQSPVPLLFYNIGSKLKLRKQSVHAHGHRFDRKAGRELDLVFRAQQACVMSYR